MVIALSRIQLALRRSQSGDRASAAAGTSDCAAIVFRFSPASAVIALVQHPLALQATSIGPRFAGRISGALALTKLR